jgi:hypothetical protein
MESRMTRKCQVRFGERDGKTRSLQSEKVRSVPTLPSTLYTIEHTFNPRIRTKYPWGRGMSKWVRDMGSLERIVEYKPQHDRAGVYSGKQRVDHKPKEAPGCSPLLVAEIIDHCVFVGLSDMGIRMPEFEEIPVSITPDPAVAANYAQAKDLLGKYLFQCRLEGDASALGMYLQTLLSYPSAPYREERCIHRKRVSRDSDVFVELPVYTIPALSEDDLYAKERWLIDTVADELSEGRGVAVFCRQTGTRDIQPRIAQLLREHVPLANPFILKGSVKADRREALLDERIASGVNVLICNPELVKTGLDLVALPTIIFFEVSYSLYTMAQASRRAWRLIQKRPCKVYYPYYEGLMEGSAVELVGRKGQAAALLYGESTTSGLSALNGSDSGNLLAALASEIDSDGSVTDLKALFAKHAMEIQPGDSAWLNAETPIIPPGYEVPQMPPPQYTIPTHKTAADPLQLVALHSSDWLSGFDNVLPLPRSVPNTTRKSARKSAGSKLPQQRTLPLFEIDPAPLGSNPPVQLTLF